MRALSFNPVASAGGIFLSITLSAALVLSMSVVKIMLGARRRASEARTARDARGEHAVEVLDDPFEDTHEQPRGERFRLWQTQMRQLSMQVTAYVTGGIPK